MKHHQQSHAADLIRQQRFKLEGLRAGLDDGRGELIDSVMRRMFDVEYALELDLTRRSLRGKLDRRRRELTSPRIGHLRHHEAKQLLLPASYWNATPPEPAPAIAIVTPSFGQGRFIERTLYSVISQEYPQLQYVIQDGGSSDETLSILRHHSAELSRWASVSDAGQADGLNRGFADTTGEIMGYLNSDDLLLPGALAYVARYFASHPEVDVVYGHRVLIDERDRQIGTWVLPAHDDEAMTLVDYVPQETMFWRRRVWEASGAAFDTSLRFAIDWDLLLRFREAGATFVRLPRFLGAFRVHEAQKTQREQDLSDADCALLRARTHGRAVDLAEAVARTQPYLRRHVRAHLRSRLATVLTRRRRPVRTIPPNAWTAHRAGPAGDHDESPASAQALPSPTG